MDHENMINPINRLSGRREDLRQELLAFVLLALARPPLELEDGVCGGVTGAGRRGKLDRFHLTEESPVVRPALRHRWLGSARLGSAQLRRRSSFRPLS